MAPRWQHDEDYTLMYNQKFEKYNWKEIADKVNEKHYNNRTYKGCISRFERLKKNGTYKDFINNISNMDTKETKTEEPKTPRTQNIKIKNETLKQEEQEDSGHETQNKISDESKSELDILKEKRDKLQKELEEVEKKIHNINTNKLKKEIEEKSKNLSSNEKRKKSCKLVGGYYKKEGHKKEENFNKKYNPKCNNLTMKAESDCEISENHPIIDKLFENYIIKNKNERFTSNKSGKSIQLVLGNIPELLVKNNLEWIQNKNNFRTLLNKYMKKTNSNKPADLLVYDTGNSRIFFNMNDVIEYIVNNCELRKLDSGRIKGDFIDNSKKGKGQYFTYEYRDGKHKSYFLGFSGGRGRPFIMLIKNKINYYEELY